jgi:hypothetical protein
MNMKVVLFKYEHLSIDNMSYIPVKTTLFN